MARERFRCACGAWFEATPDDGGSAECPSCRSAHYRELQNPKPPTTFAEEYT